MANPACFKGAALCTVNDTLDRILSLFPFLVLIKGLKDNYEHLQWHLISKGEDKRFINQGEKVFKDRIGL